MVTIKSPLTDTDQKIARAAPQGALVDLIDLSLIAKQAHWNVVGRNFRSADALTQDLLIEIAQRLEQMSWMCQAEQ